MLIARIHILLILLPTIQQLLPRYDTDVNTLAKILFKKYNTSKQQVKQIVYIFFHIIDYHNHKFYPKIMRNLNINIANFDLSQHINSFLKKADKPFWSAFFTLFITLNLIFLYHGSHFLFGDHDWQYIKNGIPIESGLFEGRFSQFLPINILSKGEILPIINNFLGFLGFSLGISLLAKYWQIPHNKKNYILFAIFTGITPYILSFMYFAFIIIPTLSWNAFIIGALIISEKETRFSFTQTLSSMALYCIALGGYPPVINLYLTALTARILISFLHSKTTIKQQIQTHKFSILNFILGLITYKLCLIYLTNIGAINPHYYNLQTTPITEWYNKFIYIIHILPQQFTATIPFINIKYKTTTLLISLLALYCSLRNTSKSSLLLTIILFIATFLAPLTTLFISTSINETLFSPRIDFFGLMYSYSAMLAIIQKSKQQFIKNLSYILAITSIYISSIALFEAQKVWKLGFDAELTLYSRILKRYETLPSFNPNTQYTIIQGGSPSLRPKYYNELYQYKSDDLLSISYVPGMNSGVMWNYYSPKDYANTRSYFYSLKNSKALQEVLTKAKPYPHNNSITINNNNIYIFLSQSGIEYLKSIYPATTHDH